MTRADLGRATEARFLMDAHEHGLIVSRPFDSAPGYDFVVDAGARLFRVQVKGCRPSARPSRHGTRVYRVNTNRKRRARMRFDLVAVWLAADARWVFLPGRTRTRSQVTITPNGRHSRRGWEVFRRR